jgi:antitoxin VapB
MANLPSSAAPHVSDVFANYMPDPPTRHARLFRNGANQAVRIPKEFEFPPGEVTVKKIGNTLVLEPFLPKPVNPAKGTAAALVAALESMRDWPVVEEPFPDTDEGLLPLDEIDL